MNKPLYKRVALKLSGEALVGDQSFGISPDMIKYVAGEIQSVVELGVQIGIIVGGGIYFAVLRPALTGWTGHRPITWECWPQLSTAWRCRML